MNRLIVVGVLCAPGGWLGSGSAVPHGQPAPTAACPLSAADEAHLLAIVCTDPVLEPALTSPVEGERGLRVVVTRGLGRVESVAIYHTTRGRRTLVAERRTFDSPITLPHDGPFEVVVKPVGGRPVVAVSDLSVPAGSTYEFRTGDYLGAIEVLGDDLPRAERVVVTAVSDPGPGERGHQPLQEADDYRTQMLLPPGTYAVWVVPANGARPQRVADNIRVQAGRSVRIPEPLP